jgi:anti-sigma B factor antagonist
VDVESSKRGRVVLLKPLGRWLDERSSRDLNRVVEGEIGRGERYLVLDLSEVAYVDSSGFGTLIRLLKLLPQDGKLVLCKCRPAVQQLIEKARLQQVLAAYPSDAAAVASLSGVAPPN